MNWISILLGGLTGFLLANTGILLNEPMFWIIIIPQVLVTNTIETLVKCWLKGE